ncbi:MAG: hypothetical protein PSV13_19295 [Lacunisphaera sp.]|nr:hypothetical protein [Lacunisphaera sp.]
MILVSVACASADEGDKASRVFRNIQVKAPDISGAVSALKLEPLAGQASKSRVRMIATGWWFSSVSIEIPDDGTQAPMAEQRSCAMDASTKQAVLEIRRAVLTEQEITSLKAALRAGGVFASPLVKNSARPPIDSGCYFIETASATDYRWVYRAGLIESSPDCRELATILFRISSRLESLPDTSK